MTVQEKNTECRGDKWAYATAASATGAACSVGQANAAAAAAGGSFQKRDARGSLIIASLTCNCILNRAAFPYE